MSVWCLFLQVMLEEEKAFDQPRSEKIKPVIDLDQFFQPIGDCFVFLCQNLIKVPL